MADERELQEQGVGVGTGDSTESAPSTAEPVAPPATAPKINLDELPEFRRFRSEYDRKLAETERRYQQMLAQQQQQLRERQVAELDDYGRLELERNEALQREQYANQRLQEIEVEQAKMRVLREVSAEMGVPVEAIAEAADVADAWRLAAIKQRELQQQREVERQAELNRRVAERTQKVENNRVDTGSGTPIPQNDWERGYQELKAKGKTGRDLFAFALNNKQG